MYSEIYYHEYCDDHGNTWRVSLLKDEDSTGIILHRRGHFNDWAPSEIGIFKEGFDFSFLLVGDTLVISGSENNNGTYEITGWVDAVDYIRMQLSPQVPVQVHEDVTITIFPQITPIPVEAGVDPFVIDRENTSEMKVGGVFPTRATATFISGGAFSLQELYDGNETTYQLRRTRNGVLDWQGFVVPNGFTESVWDDQRPQLIVKATDNLSTLKGKQFVDEFGDNYGLADGNMQSYLWVVKGALKKTGFLMPIWTMVDLKSMMQAETNVFELKVVRNVAGFLRFIFDNDLSGGNDFEALLNVGTTLKITSGILGERTFTVNDSRVWLPGSIYVWVDVWVDEEIPPFTSHNVRVEVIQEMVPSGIQDPLAHTEHDVRVWIRDSDIEGRTYYEARGGAMSTWDVLDAIARQWGAVVQQNNGHWEVKRWNADKIADGQYEWFVYNAEGVQIGRQPFGGDRYMPCLPTQDVHRVYGTVVSMDRVLLRAIVNYRYKYKQDGDNLNNLIVNGNFEGELNPYPRGWDKVHVDNVTAVPEMGISRELADLPPGFNTGIRIVNHADTRTFSNLTELSNTQVNRGDRLIIKWYERVDGVSGGSHTDSYCGIYSISIYSDLDYAYATSRRGVSPRGRDTVVYNLVNDGTILTPFYRDDPRPPFRRQIFGSTWRNQQEESGSPENTRFATFYPINIVGEYGLWREVTIETNDIPIDGFLKFEVLGATRDKLVLNIEDWALDGILSAPVFAPSGNSGRNIYDGSYTKARRSFYRTQDNVSMVITGIFVGKIVDPNNEAVPRIDPFMYPDHQAQLSRKYTDTIPEIEVLTGDDYGQYADDRVSSMWQDGQRTSMWDTWDNRYGWSRQGLVTAKSIMEMYWEPSRLMDCRISMEGMHWSTRFTFEEFPGKRFVILRGSLGGRNNMFSGTLTQIHDEGQEALPPGGNDGGNTVDPNWQPTGISRCVRGEDGTNTGMVEMVEADINPASPTYGQQRWVDTDEDTEMCPVGDPVDIFWGEQLTLNVDSLRYYPVLRDGDAYQVTYGNDGSDVYLRMLHRADMGLVRSVMYENGMESIAAWIYEPDVVINGYTYKSMRLSWFVGVFTDLPVVFVIN